MARKGENIFKRKDGRWEGRYIKARNGRKAIYGYVFGKSYSEVKNKKSEAMRLCKEAVPATRIGSPLFKDVAFQWLDELKPIRKKSTIVKYSGQLKNHIIPAFGHTSIGAISNEDIISFRQKLMSEGRQGRKLSPKTVADILSRMKSIRRFALLHGYEVKFIPDSMKIQQPQVKIRILSSSEEKRLLSYLKNNFDLTALGIFLSLFTGLRIGELCALKWNDFSFAEEEFRVQRTMQRLHNFNEHSAKKTSLEIGAPKSPSSIRSIPIPEKLMDYLRSAYVEDAYVLSGEINRFVEPRTMGNRFKSVLRKCGIKAINFHALRHTFATKCVELGFDVKSLSEILGHSNVNITLNRYVHPSMESKHANMNKLNPFICSQNSGLNNDE